MAKTTFSEPAISISDLSVRYPAHGASAPYTAINGLSFTVAHGEVLGVLGESGSGKSTLARILSGNTGVEKSSSANPHIIGGEATILGYPMRRISKRQLRRLTFEVNLLPQDAGEHLMPMFTVSEIISEPILARDRRHDRRIVGARVAAMLDAVHLPLGTADSYPYQLSSGQRQRVAIARALVLGPSVLIADEPTSGIDVTVRNAVVDLINELSLRQDFSAIVISSDLSVLRRISSRIAVLHQGKLVGLGTVDDVLANPRHPYVEGLRTALPELIHDRTSPTAVITSPAVVN
jgi:ABC-type glutathione transport system ATPase component